MNTIKIGSWVRHKITGVVHQITTTNADDFTKKISPTNPRSFDCSCMGEFELWHPIDGEYVVIHPIHPTMSSPTSFYVKKYFSNDVYWKNNKAVLEPFIGALPSFIEDTQKEYE